MVAMAGPLGSSDHRSLGLLGITDVDPLPMPSLADVVDTVGNTPGCFGVVPIENSTEGELTLALDRLVFSQEGVHIISEAVLGEEIWAMGLADASSIHTVISHSMILDLCGDFIRHNGLRVVHAVSTASACEEVVRLRDSGTAALAPPRVGLDAGLVEYDRRVTELGEIRTRYALIGQEIPEPTGDDRTRLVVTPGYDAAGSLATIAQRFAQHQINMFSIISRPLTAAEDLHCFVVGLTGHVQDEPVRAMIEDLVSDGHSVKLLGSYPRWKGVSVAAPSSYLPRPTSFSW